MMNLKVKTKMKSQKRKKTIKSKRDLIRSLKRKMKKRQSIKDQDLEEILEIHLLKRFQLEDLLLKSFMLHHKQS